MFESQVFRDKLKTGLEEYSSGSILLADGSKGLGAHRGVGSFFLSPTDAAALISACACPIDHLIFHVMNIFRFSGHASIDFKPRASDRFTACACSTDVRASNSLVSLHGANAGENAVALVFFFSGRHTPMPQFVSRRRFWFVVALQSLAGGPSVHFLHGFFGQVLRKMIALRTRLLNTARWRATSRGCCPGTSHHRARAQFAAFAKMFTATHQFFCIDLTVVTSRTVEETTRCDKRKLFENTDASFAQSNLSLRCTASLFRMLRGTVVVRPQPSSYALRLALVLCVFVAHELHVLSVVFVRGCSVVELFDLGATHALLTVFFVNRREPGCLQRVASTARYSLPPPARRACFRSEPGPSLPTPHCCWSPWRETVLSLLLIPGRRLTSSSTMRGLARLCVRFGSPHARLPLRARTGGRAGDQLARLSCSSACLNDLPTRFGGRGRFPLLCGVAEIAMPLRVHTNQATG